MASAGGGGAAASTEGGDGVADASQKSLSSQQQSPRNTGSGSSAAVAVATNNSPFVQMGAIEVPKALQDGEKFIKWDEESGIGTPVTLRVDPKGFFLYWADQNNEIDLLDIALVRDVRTGPYAKKPRDMKLRQIVTMGSVDTLEQKTVTVCYATDFVNVTFVNFCCTRKDIAQVWTDELMKLACNMIQQNGSTSFYLQKAHTKLCLQVDKSGKIPVKSIIKLFASSKDDRRRVEKALDVSGLPSGKGELLPLSKLQFEDFFNLYKNLTQRSEVEKIFDELVGASKRRLMSTSQVVDFLNRTQRDPRLNEILHPYANPARARDLINEYEPNKFNAQKGQLSLDGFLRYLMSENNPIMAVTKLDICDDMDQPMAHYFINSSHNTYLTGHQLTGKSSVEIYRQSLLAGCRCVELDFWNGKLEEPIIVHGYTFVPEITARDVLEAIAESAFKTSDYPVILSFENHCNPRQQAKIANYCREIFGDMLLDKPLESHPLEPNVDLPPPSMLKRKIIIKNKKKHHHHHHGKRAHLVQQQQQAQSLAPVEEVAAGAGAVGNNANESPQKVLAPVNVGNGDIPSHAPALQQIRQGSVESTGSSDTDSSSDDESLPIAPTAVDPRDKVQQSKETEAGAEISALVNYVQPIHFSSFENAEKKMKCYEMSSFDEKQATTLLKERPLEFVNYNKHQLSRVYPAGTRFDSSNFMPQLFWNAGCQLVALNYQTMDLAMQLNQGIFEYNRRSGYLLKPEFMRRIDRRLDPFAESTVDGIIAGTVSITVLSGQFLTDKKIGTYVEVDMYGLPADTVRKRFRTRIVRENGVNPVFGEEPFVFKKVVLPELASVRITAYEESGKFIGHRVLPVIGLCPGYRHVNLRNELGQPLLLATLFLCIVVKDYVPDGLSDFAEALANPIKYQSELEKRAEQLAVLTEDTEPIPDDDSMCQATSSSTARQSKTDTLPRGQQSVTDGGPFENGAENASSSIGGSSGGGVGGGGTMAGSAVNSFSGGATVGSGTASSYNMQQQSQVSSISHNASGGGGGFSSSGLSVGTASSSSAGGAVSAVPTTSQQSGTVVSVSSDSTAAAVATTSSGGGGGASAKSSEAIEADAITAEPLESILANKVVREKRQEMEKKLESLRKKHDKEKLRICSSPKSGESSSDKKSKFNMGNKLVKRLSSKNIDPTLQVPPCPSELLDVVEEGDEEDKPSITRSHSERLLTVCREFANNYREIQEKYHESIYNAAEKQLRSSQASQMKRLKQLLEKETSDVMRKLQVDRRNEVKALTQKHRDRDELVRMKREVASSLVERGVTERLRLAQAFEKRREDLQRQHDVVKTALQDHRSKAKTLIEKDTESRSCVGPMDGFLVLFDAAVMRATNSTSGGGGEASNAMSESQSASAIC